MKKSGVKKSEREDRGGKKSGVRESLSRLSHREGDNSYYAMRPSTTVPSSPIARTVRGPAATEIMLD